jgi:WD40 repeat protein
MHCECSMMAASAAVQSQLPGVVEHFDLHTGQRVLLFSTSNSASNGFTGQPQQACSQVNTLQLTHNGNLVLTGGADGTVRVWDARTGAAMVGWAASNADAPSSTRSSASAADVSSSKAATAATPLGVACLRLAAGENTVFAAALDGSVCEWSLHRMGQVLRRLDAPPSLSPTPSRGNPATAAHVNTSSSADSHAAHFVASTQFFARPEFSLSDGRTRFAVLSDVAASHPSSNSARALLYSVSHAAPKQALLGHAGPVLSVDWHPSASMIASASLDHTARLVTLKETATRSE